MDVLIFTAGCDPRDEANAPWWVGDLLGQIENLLSEVRQMNETINTLVERVAAVETVSASAIALLNGLRDALDEAIAGGDMAAVADLNARLAVQTEALAAAVAENTIAAGSEPTPEVPVEDQLPLPVDTDQSPQ